MGNWCEWISNLYKVKLFSYYRPAAANGKWKAALVIVYLSQVTTAINTCMQIVHQLECVHLFVPCGNEPGQKSFRHLQMYFFRSNGGIRKTKKSSMSLHSFMQSRRSRARRRIWQRGSSAAAASSTLLPLIRTHSFHSISGSFPLEHHKKGIQGNSEEDQNCVPHLGCSHLILQLSVFRIQWSIRGEYFWSIFGLEVL